MLSRYASVVVLDKSRSESEIKKGKKKERWRAGLKCEIRGEKHIEERNEQKGQSESVFRGFVFVILFYSFTA